MLVGKNNDQPSFWLDGDQNVCIDDYMSTTEITVEGGKVTASRCDNPQPSTAIGNDMTPNDPK